MLLSNIPVPRIVAAFESLILLPCYLALMAGIGIGLDLGTSGFRAQSLDLATGEALLKAYTLCHPLPGGNVIDHLMYADIFGPVLARKVIVKTINRLLESVCDPRDVEIIAVCGNPGQLSLLEGLEIRDLLIDKAGLARKGITPPSRHAHVRDSRCLGLEPDCCVLVPPAIAGEVGADALAMILKTGILNEGSSLATDYGTNAEMAIVVNSKLLVGSTAAGPAIEGGHIRHGMLAAPGAITDIEYDWGWKLKVLDDAMQQQDGDTIDMGPGRLLKKGPSKAMGITGTGVIALVSAGLATGVIEPPVIRAPGNELRLQDGITFNEADLFEAGKAFGAIRAGHLALADHAGIPLEKISTCHMAGAAGLFLDPLKAKDVGIIPGTAAKVIRHGNTSLEMAADLVLGIERLGTLQALADSAEHIDFSTSEAFKGHFIKELAYWCEGARYPRVICTAPTEIVSMAGRPPPSRTIFCRPVYRIAVPEKAEAGRNCPRHALRGGERDWEVDLRKCRGASCLRCLSHGIRLENLL